jgi:putative membrane protein
MRNTTQIVVAIGALGLYTALCGPVQGQTTVQSDMDKTFAMKAAQGGMAEVKLGELAAKQGASERVKQFGQRMVDDHGKANDDLKQIASNKSLTLPTDLDAKSKALYARLEKLHGAAFDNAYLKAMRQDHAKDIADFKKEAANGRDADIKGFASRTLPVIEEHYKMLQGNGSQTSDHKM